MREAHYIGGVCMEFPVVHLGQTIGRCRVTDQGLYWSIDCECEILSDGVERLYCGDQRLGVLERSGSVLTCRRRVSKSSMPLLSQAFSLAPQENRTGFLLGKPVECQMEGEMLLFPYAADEPCPCEQLICFFEIKDGFWRLPVNEQWFSSVAENPSCT